MKKKALAEFEARMSKAETMEKLADELKKGKLVAVPFCSMGKEGAACADEVKAKTSGDVRGTRFGKEERAHGNCIVCGKKACAVAYVASQY